MKPSKLQAVIHGTLISYVLTALLLTALAFLLYRLHLEEGQVSLGINLIYIVSCLAGGFLAGKAVRQRRFLWGFFTGVFYFLILSLVSFAVSRELGIGSRELLTVFLMCAGSGTIGGMIS
ncbi:MAG: TIGR04086 family membrane protein [Clostridium sp.]|jgi:putative membrane protein (TIGR04086 family)|nr:TIGR04086 family membrane protein [Clostridium sp.]